jgi:hypothetical protein
MPAAVRPVGDNVAPDHSSLTRIRDRYGLEVFRRIFEHVVEQCIAAGLVGVRELSLDATNTGCPNSPFARSASYPFLRPLHDHAGRSLPISKLAASAGGATSSDRCTNGAAC